MAQLMGDFTNILRFFLALTPSLRAEMVAALERMGSIKDTEEEAQKCMQVKKRWLIFLSCLRRLFSPSSVLLIIRYL